MMATVSPNFEIDFADEDTVLIDCMPDGMSFELRLKLEEVRELYEALGEFLRQER